MTSPAPTRRAKPSEQGFILIAVMILLALLIISMAVALPKISADIQRDRELETYHRGMQYRRAIQLYYKKFNRYPPNVDALVKTNEIRFLRKKYKDPITGKDDWKPIMLGQNKAPLAMGFFGQPLGGSGFGGMILGGGGVQGGNGFGGPGSGAVMPGAVDANGNPIDLNSGTPGGGGPGAGVNPGSPGGGLGSPGGGPGTTVPSPGNPGDPTAGAGQSTAGGGMFGANPVGGQAFGGAGIVGFSPAIDKQSIIVYKKMNHYNQWEFTYSPLSDMGLGGFQQGPPQLMPGPGAPGTGGMGGPGAGGGPAPGLGPGPGPSPAPQQ